MSKWIAVLVLAIALIGCGTEPNSAATSAPAASPTSAPTAAPTIDPAANEIKPRPIDSVEVQIRESLPVQVAVLVTGALTDGCTEFHQMQQVRSGNTIEITITTIRPKDVPCTQELTIYTNTIALDGEFSTGTYIVRVNGVEKTFTINTK
jgi:inhibitor of cysteine peptidase